MIGRIVEIADDHRHLSALRGFLLVHDTGNNMEELGRVALDDIAAVIGNAHGLSYTNNLLVALAERGAPFVLCGANHNPVGMLLPVDGNYQQAKRLDAQLQAGLPLRKRLWAELIRAKLQQQASVLEAVGAPHAPVASLIRKVKAGDPDNLEAQGARKYWGLLFGDNFRRDQNAAGLNALLNYGYTILRASTARAVIAAGLHPTPALHHRNENNPMRLVDDLMEPFRPMVDLQVWQQWRQAQTELTPDTKRHLVKTMYADMQTTAGATPIMVCLQRLSVSLAQIYLGEREKLDLPLPGIPLELATTG